MKPTKKANIIRIISAVSPSEKQQIGWLIEGYLKKSMGYNSPMIVEEFQSFYDLKGNFSIGYSPESQLVYVIDKHSLPQESKMTLQEIQEARAEYNKDGGLRMFYDMSLRLLDEEQIPRLSYEGELADMRKGKKVTPSEREMLVRQFLTKFDAKELGKESVRERMLKRI